MRISDSSLLSDQLFDLIVSLMSSSILKMILFQINSLAEFPIPTTLENLMKKIRYLNINYSKTR